MDGPTTVLLSELVGRPVVTEVGRPVGRVADLTVTIGTGRPEVERLLIRTSRTSGLLASWSDVARLDATQVALRLDAAPAPADVTRPSLDGQEEVLLARDVLDTQVVDLRGHRLSRVSEVLLQQVDGALEVAAVDLGVGGLLRRLGLGPLARRTPVLAVAWPDLHLTSRRGHTAQLSTSTASFRRLDARDLAELLARLSTHGATDVIRAVEPAHAAAALHHSHPRTGRRLLHALSPAERRTIVAAAADKHARTITRWGPPRSPLGRRRFLRTAGWRLHRPPRA